MTEREWTALTVRLHAEAKAKAKYDAKKRRAGYSTGSWKPEDATRKPRGWAAQMEE